MCKIKEDSLQTCREAAGSYMAICFIEHAIMLAISLTDLNIG